MVLLGFRVWIPETNNLFLVYLNFTEIEGFVMIFEQDNSEVEALRRNTWTSQWQNRRQKVCNREFLPFYRGA